MPKTGCVLTRRKLRAKTRFSTENRYRRIKKKEGNESSAEEEQQRIRHKEKQRAETILKGVWDETRCCGAGGGGGATGRWVVVYRCVKLGKNESTA